MRAIFLILFVPLSLLAQDFRITDVVATNGQYEISWQNGTPPFEVHRMNTPGTNEASTVYGPYTDRTASIADSEARGFYRIAERIEPAAQTAEYRITFVNMWSAQNHPTQYPAGAHYSTFYVGVHNSSVSFWNPNIPASTGIKNMAETGSTGVLRNEYAAAQTAGTVLNHHAFLTNTTLSQDYPLISITTMIAPSPDWFIGVHDLALFDGSAWVEDLTVDLFPYDADTDTGATYSPSPTNNPNPNPGNIFRITGAPFLNNGQVHPLGTIRFERIQP